MNTSSAPLIRKTGFRYGIVLGVVSSALFFAMTLLKISTGGWGALPALIFTIALIYLAHLYFKENNNGTMTFGQGVTISFWMGLASGIINSVITYVYVKFINTTYIIDTMRTEMEKSGLPDEQIDTALNITGKFMSAEVMLVSGIFGGIAYAVLFGLLVSLLTKKVPNTF